MCIIYLQGFLRAVPNTPATSAALAIGDRVHMYTPVGGSVSQSQVLAGLLVECPRTEEEFMQRNKTDLTTALFDISLAGDLPEGKHMYIITMCPLIWDRIKETTYH